MPRKPPGKDKGAAPPPESFILTKAVDEQVAQDIVAAMGGDYHAALRVLEHVSLILRGDSLRSRHARRLGGYLNRALYKILAGEKPARALNLVHRMGRPTIAGMALRGALASYDRARAKGQGHTKALEIASCGFDRGNRSHIFKVAESTIVRALKERATNEEGPRPRGSGSQK